LYYVAQARHMYVNIGLISSIPSVFSVTV
jgi:hypothetical protein